MKMLKSKLMEIKEREKLEKIDDIKGVKTNIEWGAQIRSYVFMPYTLAKDTRTGYEDGQIVYTCSVCGDSYAQPAAAPGHVPDREAPDCENAVRCSVCGQTLIPAEGHDYEYQYDAVRDETGAFTDFGTWKCAKCGRTLAATEGNASFYYSLAEDADQAPAATGAPEEDAPDVTPVPEATDAPAPDGEAEAPAPARSRTGLWIGIAVAVLAVVAAEAVVLTRSLRKKSDDR